MNVVRPAMLLDAVHLSRYFGLNDGFWTGLQLDHDAAVAKDELADVLASIKPRHPA